MPALTPETVADGPNTGMRFIASLTAGTYISRPQLHPDLRNATIYTVPFTKGDPKKLKDALERGKKANAKGQPALINVNDETRSG